MKKHLLFIFAALLPFLASAQVEIEGIWYNLDAEAKLAEVTANPNDRYSGSITIPAMVTYEGEGYSVASIGSRAFAWCTELTEINIPKSVTGIESLAFEWCERLAAINIPENVTSSSHTQPRQGVHVATLRPSRS